VGCVLRAASAVALRAFEGFIVSLWIVSTLVHTVVPVTMGAASAIAGGQVQIVLKPCVPTNAVSTAPV